MLTFYHASDRLRPDIEHLARPGETSKPLTALHTFVRDYLPAILAIDIQVRDCHWKYATPGTGLNTKKVIEIFSMFLVCLLGSEDVDSKCQEYLFACLCTWSVDPDT